jgi:hypothetical protein
LNNLEHWLKRKLYRQTCLTADELGDYVLEVALFSEREAMQQHLRECPHCQADLRDLYLFLEVEPPDSLMVPHDSSRHTQPQPPTPDQASRRKTAARYGAPRSYRLNGQQMGLQQAALRSGGSSSPRFVAQLEGVTVFVEANFDPEQPDKLILSGEVSADEQARWSGALLEVRQHHQLVAVALIDDHGEYQCQPVEIAKTDIRITTADGFSIILEELDFKPPD